MNRVKQLKRYEIRETKEAKGRLKEAYTTKPQLLFSRRVSISVAEEMYVVPEQKSRCVIL